MRAWGDLSLSVVTATLSVVLVCIGVRPVCAVHTIRANDELLRLAAESGFSDVVQLLEWREIEPARGEFYWEYHDFLVRACQYYGLGLILRVDHPPSWAVRNDELPPIDVDAYASFVGMVAARYRHRVKGYIIWNEPNLAREWNDIPPDPKGYARLLLAASEAVRQADPAALVLSAGMAPTNSDDKEAVDERKFWRSLYAQGVSSAFDVLAVHAYGFGHSPFLPVAEGDGLTFARISTLRDIAVAFGDEEKPMWATECGWRTESASQDEQWQVVSVAEQGRYLGQAIRLVAESYPWLTELTVWNLSQGLPGSDEKAGYNLLKHDCQPKPALVFLQKQPPLLTGRLRRALSSTIGALLRSEEEVTILAPDVVVRLSDLDTPYPHWAKPHGGRAPVREWRGYFYVDRPGVKPWQMYLEVMQVEEQGNLVSINGHYLQPPAIPLRGRPDYASVWTTVVMDVPSGVLRRGLNEIEIWLSVRLRSQQGIRYESMQFRNIRLRPVP